jgi:hypothetical protein
MIRERALKGVLVLVGLLFLAGIYPLWRLQLDPSEQMLGGVYATLGIFLLLALRNPSANRILAVAAWSLSKMQTPGWWIAGTLSNLIAKNDFSLTLWLFLLIPVIVDAGLCFAILWGGFLLWMRVRQKACR